MGETRTNIDLVFRNGLKNYEVLPPPEAWNSIRPAIRAGQRPLLVILRIAAAAALLLSVSFFAYRLSTRVSLPEQTELAGIPDQAVLAGSPDQTVPAGSPDQAALAGSPDQAVLAASPGIQSPSVIMYPDTGETETEENNSVAKLIIAQADSAVYGELTPAAGSRIIQPVATGRTVAEMAATAPYTGIDISLQELFRTDNEEIAAENMKSLYSPAVSETGRKTGKWRISALVSPTYYTSFYSGDDEFMSRLMTDEQPGFSYSGGLALAYSINKRLSVQSGLYYSSFGQELSGITSFAGFQAYDYAKGNRNFGVMTTRGMVYTNNADVFLLDTRNENRIVTRYTRDYFDPSKADLVYVDNSLHQNFSYLELPVVLRYKLLGRALDFNLIGGLSSNILINNSVYAAIDGGRYQVGRTEGMSMFTFSSSLGMGVEYNFPGNLSLNLEPVFRYYLNPFSETPALKVHPYSFGIFSGISYRF
ncbi:MAG: PorT family protein [Bacteroidales bacterium]|nr:PorT family protein [Bacteroidales bacterium]